MKTVATFITLAVLGVVLYDFIVQYKNATTAGAQRVWDAWKGGAADLKKQAALVAASIVGFSSKIVDWACALLSDPSAADSIKGVITTWIVTPGTVAIAVAAFTVATVVANMRKLGQ